MDALKLAATVTGLSLSDVKLRLTGNLPRVLLTDGDIDRVQVMSAELEKNGFITLVCDPADAPGDEDRVVARHLELSPTSFEVIERTLARHSILGADIALLQRGFRSSATRETVTSSERKLSLGRAALSGGLLLTKQVQKTSTQVGETREAFLLVQRLGNQPEVILYEKQLDYRFLGAEIQPAAYGNLHATMKRIRSMAPQAPLDERVARAGFVQPLGPYAVSDPLDLALHVIKLAHLRQANH
jgi:hypothetical protein